MCNETCARLVLIVFNVVFLLTGIGVLGAAVYVNFIKTEYDELIESSMFAVVTYLMMGAGTTVVFVSLAGCVGAVTKNKAILTTYGVFLILIFLLEATSGILGFICYDKIRSIVDDNFTVAILNKYGYDDYRLVSHGIDFIQQKIHCCGFMEPEDWVASNYFKDTNVTIVADRGATKVPISCCKNINKVGCNNEFDADVFSQGCRTWLEIQMKNNLMFVGVASMSISLVQLVGVIQTIVLIKKSEEDGLDF